MEIWNGHARQVHKISTVDGGGVVFALTLGDYLVKMNKKEKRGVFVCLYIKSC